MIAEFQVPITKEIQEKAQALAAMTGYTVEEMMPVLMLILSGLAFSQATPIELPVIKWSDESVLAVADLRLQAHLDLYYLDLLHEQAERDLSLAEQKELQLLLHIYEVGLLLKAEALAEAVKRGLLAPLS